MQKVLKFSNRKCAATLLLLGLTFVWVFFAVARMGNSSCIFCDIIAGRKPETEILLETDEFVIFKDIKPASTYHYLAVPKRHIDSLKTTSKNDEPLVARMEEALKQLMSSNGVDLNEAIFGFHYPPFISVGHLHLHGIAPKSKMNFYDSYMFKADTAWFKSVENARNYIKNKEL